MKIPGIFLIIFLFQCVGIQSQTSHSSSYKKDPYSRLMESYSDDGQVRIYADSLIIEHYYKHLLKNKQASGIPGYRIRIFSESGVGAKDRQKRVRANFLSLYPTVDAYYSYDGLNFKVYVGDCRTRSEASLLYDRVSRNFPNAIIVRDNINIDRID
ncbi:MAG: hypothetical protein JXR52_12855 [Bacteroidales bacterium]|nr:hypothetical protein [Bacteroidales bacterium]MBN2699708.1 hypothetical protein [Bacteroidales bacterium]